MAGALIPLALTALPAIADLIAGLVHRHAPVIEAIRGPGTGPVKIVDLFGVVISDLNAAAAAGSIDKALPPDESIKLIIQSVVSSMKLQGLLNSTPALSAAVPAVAQQPQPNQPQSFSGQITTTK